MKRLHLHVNVENLEDSIAFYETLFGAEPSVRRTDYAKWLLDDPRVNFAISSRGRAAGLDHLGIQVGSAEELAETAGRLKAAGRAVFEQAQATCCYAVSDKAWSVDRAGLSWETFRSTGEAAHYGDGSRDADEGPRPTGAPPEGPTAEPCCSAAGPDPARNTHAGRCC
jgi:catechol 2,3-dioxygenase-like lactoylglutathione lyase family enzyme